MKAYYTVIVLSTSTYEQFSAWRKVTRRRGFAPCCTITDLWNPVGEFFDFFLHGSWVESDIVCRCEWAERCSQLNFAGWWQRRTATDRRHAHLQLGDLRVQLTDPLPASKMASISMLRPIWSTSNTTLNTMSVHIAHACTMHMQIDITVYSVWI